MKKYDAYKDSGVDWIGDVPVGWGVKRIKHLITKIGSGVTPRGGAETYVDKGIMLLRSQNIHFDGLKLNDVVYITNEVHGNMPNSEVAKGDVLINITGGSIGRCYYISDDISANVNQHVCIVRPDFGEAATKYLYFYLSSELGQVQIDKVQVGGNRAGLNFEQLKNFTIPTPPLPEQQKIATYLTHKTAQLDQTIADRRALIELLEEERAAVINEAVTRGLDPNVAMKDSGVEWLGAVPEHWGITRLKYVTNKIIDGTHFTPTYIDAGVPFLRVKDIKKKEINLDEVKYISQEEHEELSKRCQPEKGDILLSKNGTIGILKVVDWEYEFSLFVSVCLIKPRTMLSADFFKWFFRSNAVDQQIKESSKTTSVTNLHLDKIRELIMVLPGIEEQNAIAEFVKVETDKIEEDITSAEQEIALLEEYRQALITEVVTGKVDVRGREQEVK